MNTKICTKCKEIKDLSEFDKRSRSKDGLKSRCKTCSRKDHYLWQKSNPNNKYKSKRNHELKNPDKTRDKKLRQKYGLTSKEYDDILNKQNESCAICKRHKSEFKKALHTDHNHSSGEIRGILCQKCNRGLGYFNDNPELLKAAIDYITKLA